VDLIIKFHIIHTKKNQNARLITYMLRVISCNDGSRHKASGNPVREHLKYGLNASKNCIAPEIIHRNKLNSKITINDFPFMFSQYHKIFLSTTGCEHSEDSYFLNS